MTSAAVGILGGPELVSYLPILEGTNPVKDLITSSIGKIENVLFFMAGSYSAIVCVDGGSISIDPISFSPRHFVCAPAVHNF